MLDNIVCRLPGHDILVLDYKGTELKTFHLDHCPMGIWYDEKFIFVMQQNGIVAYDLEGRIQWQSAESFVPQASTVVPGRDGFYILAPRVDTAVREAEHHPVGFDFPQQYDLWASHIGFDGQVKWDRKIQDNAHQRLSIFISEKNKRIIVPFSESESEQGILLLNENGNLLESVCLGRIAGYPQALAGDLYLYMLLPDSEAEPCRIAAYNIAKKRHEFVAETYKRFRPCHGNQGGCSSLGENLFLTDQDSIVALDLATRSFTDFDVPNYDVIELAGMLVADVAPKEFLQSSRINKIGKGQLRAFDDKMNELWRYNMPHEFTNTPYGVHNCNNKAILLNEYDQLILVDSSGKAQWKNTVPRYIMAVAYLI